MRHLRLWWGIGTAGLFIAAVIVSANTLAPSPGEFGPSTTRSPVTATGRPPTIPPTSSPPTTGRPPSTVTGLPGPPGPPGPPGAPGQVLVVTVPVPAPTLPPATTTATTAPVPAPTRCRPPPSRPHPSSTTHPCLPTH